MTTVACNRQEIAADSCFTFDYVGSGVFKTEKLYRVGKSIFSEAGEGGTTTKIIQWIKDGQKRGNGKVPIFTKEEQGQGFVIELNKDGIFIWDHGLFPYPVLDDFIAIGSGRMVALYAMKELKMTPEQAVREACKVDDATREPIHVMKVEE